MPKFPFKVKFSPKQARMIDEIILNRVMRWIEGVGGKPESPKVLFRGIPKGAKYTPSEGFEHATPWLSSAQRGGKGGFGDPLGHDVYAFEAKPDQLYYRGGALSGDPLESTKIDTTAGVTWDEILEVAKGLSKSREQYSVRRSLWNALFETDVRNKPGIWHGKNPPSSLRMERPRLRSTYDIMDELDEMLAKGVPMEEVEKTPSAKILRGTTFWDMWRNK